MRTFWLFMVALVAIWPVGWDIIAIDGKQIDAVSSDIMLVCMPLIYFLARTKPTKSQLDSVSGKPRGNYAPPLMALVLIIYFMSLAGIGVVMSGERVRLLSAFKLSKTFTFLIGGMLLGSWVDPYQFIDKISRAFAVVVALTLYFTITAPLFPFGDWGRYLFGAELSGWPNSPMSFYGCLVPLLLALADYSSNIFAKMISWSAAGCCALIILGSMSRSSTIVMVLGSAFYLALTGRVALLATCSAITVVLCVIGFGLFNALRDTEFMTVLMDRVQMRFERSIGSEDPSAGRFDIWQQALELWTDSPVFGYYFEPFSHYSIYDTPHQQYLEIVYKCGGLGLVMYLTTLGCCLSAVRGLLKKTRIRCVHYYQLNAIQSMMIALCLGNLTQPNLTYSVTGNFVFLVFGCLCSPRAVIALTKPMKTVIAKPKPAVTAPMLRIAG